MDKKGKLIVIEGTDGSGKKTQTELLFNRVLKEGVKASTIDFPRYGTPSCYFVEKYLHGGYGQAQDVGPYVGSLFYTLDRYDHSRQIKDMLAEGTTVLCDRFTSANMGHQAGKIDDPAKRDEYLAWLDNLEFEMCGIPRPDLTILLYVSPETNQKLMATRADKEYLKGKKADIHEADLGHLKKASEAYLYVAKKYGWSVIDCAPTGELLSREAVHEIVWAEVAKKLN